MDRLFIASQLGIFLLVGGGVEVKTTCAPIDLDRLIKYLNLSTSDQDGEALTAIRYANSVLKRAGLTWEEFLSDLGRSKQEDEETVDDGPEYYINSLFLSVLGNEHLGISEENFVLSLSQYFENKGYLTPKQLDALERIKKRLDRKSHAP